ncbi:hypothetical protein M0Q97_12520 [Candidatus Dojkabacteria bacterium]|jgi:hypothetical protein|nr:hypothetical protein [Candidatus Dojkabacteria bacterium]
MKLTIEQLKKLTTVRLLNLYKSERTKMYSKGYRFENNQWNCQYISFIDSNRSDIFNDDVNYLELIKNELENRENLVSETKL